MSPRIDVENGASEPIQCLVAHWRIELSTQDVVALSEGHEITVAAIDEEQEGLSDESIDVTLTLSDL